MPDNPTHKEREIKKVMEAAPAPEWRFTVFKEPAGLRVDHVGDPMLVLSQAELWRLIRGEVTMATYGSIPRSLYRAFMVKVCEAIGVPYRAYYLDAVTPPPTKRVYFELPRKKEWDVLADKALQDEVRIKQILEEVNGWERFLKMTGRKKR